MFAYGDQGAFVGRPIQMTAYAGTGFEIDKKDHRDARHPQCLELPVPAPERLDQAATFPSASRRTDAEPLGTGLLACNR
jgi:hypothetical protein